MTVTYASVAAAAEAPLSGSGTSHTFSLTTHADNNLIVFGLAMEGGSGQGITGIGSSNISQFTSMTAQEQTAGFSNTYQLLMFYGIANGASTQTATVTFGQSVTNANLFLDRQEFSSSLGANGLWSIDLDQFNYVEASGSSLDYPSLTPSQTGLLYTGWGFPSNSLTSGGTPAGFVFQNISSSGDQMVYNLNAPATVAPIGGQSPSGNYAAFSVVMRSDSPALWVPPTTGMGFM